MKNTKENIAKVAFELFLQNSFKGVTMNEIVKKTRLSKGAFYHYFKSKEQLFWEVLNQYFFHGVTVDYSKLSCDSLLQFYNEYLAELRKKMLAAENDKKFSLKNANYFFLIFEGMRLFPEFCKKLDDYHKEELDAWKNIVGIARKKGEIKSNMADEQIAKLFIVLSDGIGIRLVVEGADIENMEDEVVGMWNGIYDQLKKR